MIRSANFFVRSLSSSCLLSTVIVCSSNKVAHVNCRAVSQGCGADDPMARSPGGPIWHAEVVAGHFFRLRQAEETEERGGDVLEGAAGAQGETFVVGGDGDQGHGIQGVGGVRAASHGIN